MNAAEDRIAEASAAVRSARRRLVARAAADGAALGLGAGTLAGGLAWTIAWRTSSDAGLWPLAAPVLGALLGAAVFARRGVSADAAAVHLDAAAGTDEAFLSALTATGASTEIRALSATYAVTRCPPSSVARFLPFRAPAVASAALVGTALLAALVFVPRASDDSGAAPGGSPDATVVPPASGAASGAAGESPRSRVEQMARAIGVATAPVAPSLAAAVRKDLGSVTADDLRRLADALAKDPASADAARRAIAALDQGDRAAATAALREALGGGRTVTSPDGSGVGTAVAPAPAAATVPWAAPTWPLRYDRVVRRWLDETSAAEARPK